ncbi:MAG: diaminopimelate epimerase [Phycisphaerales bacterium]
MDFTALQSVGNGFALVDALRDPLVMDGVDIEAETRAICARASLDGVIYIVGLDPAQAEASGLGITQYARVMNADGSYGGISGNGARCVAKLLVERGHASPDEHGMFRFGMGRRVVEVRAETDGGRVTRVAVDLGPPEITLAKVPVDTSQIEGRGERAGEWRVLGRDAFFVHVGNPHMVMFREAAWMEQEMESEGRLLVAAPPFPEGMNIDFATIVDRDRVRLRTYERGVGLTRACGSGALATAVAGREMGVLDDNVTVVMPGGEIEVLHHAPTGTTWTTADVGEVRIPETPER